MTDIWESNPDERTDFVVTISEIVFPDFSNEVKVDIRNDIIDFEEEFYFDDKSPEQASEWAEKYIRAKVNAKTWVKKYTVTDD